jgi:hypothetical protein
MADSDHAAVHVQPFVRYPEPVTATGQLDRKTLVQLTSVGVVDAQPKRSSGLGTANTGPMPISSGSHPCHLAHITR